MLLGALNPEKSTRLATLPEDMLREIAKFAGVQSGEKWELIAAAAANLDILTP